MLSFSFTDNLKLLSGCINSIKNNDTDAAMPGLEQLLNDMTLIEKYISETAPSAETIREIDEMAKIDEDQPSEENREELTPQQQIERLNIIKANIQTQIDEIQVEIDSNA